MNKYGLVVGRAGSGNPGIIYIKQDGPDLNKESSNVIVSYHYHLNHRIAVGSLFTFCKVSDWLGYPEVSNPRENQKTGYTYVKGTSTLLVPSLKWSCLNTK